MDDIKLLELAGLAAGEKFDADNNPLERDDLALRLAVKLNLDVMTSCTREEIQVGGAVRSTTFQPIDGDRFAATRRAIVRAAAALAPTP